MPLQLRTYTLQPGTLERWTAVWQQHIRPLREQLGFSVPAAWTVPERNQFVWLMSYDGPLTWAEADASFHSSPGRLSIAPNPADMIVHLETCFVEPVA